MMKYLTGEECERKCLNDNGPLRKILIQLAREEKISQMEHLHVLARTPWLGEKDHGARKL